VAALEFVVGYLVICCAGLFVAAKLDDWRSR
jgi:hypothetical protein